MAEARSQGGSSLVGHHFISSYQDCPRRWYLQFEQRIVPRYVGKALTFGIAWHKAIEVFYSAQELGTAIQAGLEVIEDAIANQRYEYSEDADVDHERFRPMFEHWVSAIGRPTLATHDVLSVEETLEIELANGFRFTGRLDEVMQERDTGAIWIQEHKSTSFSLGGMERTVALGDQVPGYILLWRRNYPDKASLLLGCKLDVTYARGRSLEAQQSRLAYSEDDLARLELNLNGLLSEMSQKLSASREGVTDALLFPRNGSACSRFKCPYESICRQFVDDKTMLPQSLKRLDAPLTYDEAEDIGGGE